jgi:hypothetical protein
MLTGRATTSGKTRQTDLPTATRMHDMRAVHDALSPTILEHLIGVTRALATRDEIE